MNELGEKVTDEQKQSVSEKINALRDAVKAEDVDNVDNAFKALEDVWNPIAQSIYASQMPSDNANFNDFANAFTGDGANPFANGNFDPSANPFAK
jgi:molecular chaperone DnaK